MMGMVGLVRGEPGAGGFSIVRRAFVGDEL